MSDVVVAPEGQLYTLKDGTKVDAAAFVTSYLAHVRMLEARYPSAPKFDEGRLPAREGLHEGVWVDKCVEAILRHAHETRRMVEDLKRAMAFGVKSVDE